MGALRTVRPGDVPTIIDRGLQKPPGGCGAYRSPPAVVEQAIRRKEQMSNLPRRRFGPGHTVSIGVSVKHTMHIDRAIAVFAHEQEDGVWLDLVGSPQLYDRDQAPEELEAWRSEAEMMLTIPARPVPGVYTLSHVILETYGGRLFRYDREELGAAAFSFEVVEEPTARPIIEGVGYM